MKLLKITADGLPLFKEKLDICFEKDSKGDYISVWYLEEFVHAYVDVQIVGEEIKYDICSTTINFNQ